MRRPGSVPLSAVYDYTIVSHATPEAVAQRGPFYIRDGWLRPSLLPGHPGQQVCYVLEFDDGPARLALEWSPLRERVLELVLRSNALVGPCRVISKPLREGMNIWTFVGIEDDGSVFDPLADVVPPASADVPGVTL